jgi:hypothetical protein
MQRARRPTPNDLLAFPTITLPPSLYRDLGEAARLHNSNVDTLVYDLLCVLAAEPQLVTAIFDE